MGNYGAATPKRHVGFSNCSSIGKLSLGRLKKKLCVLKKDAKTTRYYTNKKGVRCWVGTKNLRKSQFLVCASKPTC